MSQYRRPVDPALAFDPATHTYTFAGRRIYGVTELLKPVTPEFSKWYTPEARARGQRIHKLVECEIEGTLDYSQLDDELEDYLTQWLDFRGRVDFRPILVEQIVINKTNGYGGTLDLYGMLNGTIPALIDIKTGVVNRTVRPQTAGYKAAACALDLIPYATRRFALDLKRDRWQLSKELTAKIDESLFYDLLGVAKFKDGFYD